LGTGAQLNGKMRAGEAGQFSRQGRPTEPITKYTTKLQAGDPPLSLGVGLGFATKIDGNVYVVNMQFLCLRCRAGLCDKP
jgi:hypothetical protein